MNKDDSEIIAYISLWMNYGSLNETVSEPSLL